MAGCFTQSSARGEILSMHLDTEFCGLKRGQFARTYLKNSGSGFRARRGMAIKRSPANGSDFIGLIN